MKLVLLFAICSTSYGGTFYISSSGSDTNNGTSKSTPWLHAPAMPACASNCLAHTTVAGDQFIFRGGDTWHFGNSAAAPYTGGTWNWNTEPYPNGTSNNPIYIGVDLTWFSGGSWSRPILTGDNPTQAGLNTYVASCPYQITGIDILSLGNRQYYTIDNFEMTGMCQVGTTQEYVYINYGSGLGLQFLNLYIHGWTRTNDTINIFAFRGGAAGNGPPSDTLTNVVIDGSDSDPRAAGACYCDWWNVSNSYFTNTSQAIVRFPHVFHDNVQEYWYDEGHGNLLESVGDASGTNAFYNNIWRYLSQDGTSQVGVWLLPPPGTTDYIFNNLGYKSGPIQYMNLGNSGTNVGNYVLFNNTFQTDFTQNIFNCNYMQGGTITDSNNHFIGDMSQYSSPCNNKTSDHAILMSNAAATAAGYTASETYAYSPPASNSSTVGAGTNRQSYCTALSTAASSDPTLSDAAAACQFDFKYACTYNSTSHTVTCPARTAVARPSSAAWDVGSYEYAAGGDAPAAKRRRLIQ